MKKYILYTIGTILLFPIYAFDALGIDIDTFRKDVYRPDNLPVGTGGVDATVESKINIIFGYVTNLVLMASGGVAVFFLILGGVQYITSFGSQDRNDSAKKTIKYAIIGLLAVILAYAIVTNIIDLIFKATV